MEGGYLRVRDSGLPSLELSSDSPRSSFWMKSPALWMLRLNLRYDLISRFPWGQEVYVLSMFDTID